MINPIKLIKGQLLKNAINVALFSLLVKLNELPKSARTFSIRPDFKLFTSAISAGFVIKWNDIHITRDKLKRVIISKWAKRKVRSAEDFKDFLHDAMPDYYEIRVSIFQYAGVIDSDGIEDIYKWLKSNGL